MLVGTKGVADGKHPIQTMASNSANWVRREREKREKRDLNVILQGEQLYVPLEIRQEVQSPKHHNLAV